MPVIIIVGSPLNAGPMSNYLLLLWVMHEL